jgi:hypothetical protein
MMACCWGGAYHQLLAQKVYYLTIPTDAKIETFRKERWMLLTDLSSAGSEGLIHFPSIAALKTTPTAFYQVIETRGF